MVSSTDGSPTNTGWKRRASAASFSMCLRYSSSVVAPMQCSVPRASSGLIRFAASIEPSARPAPIRLCSSSMNRMTWPSADSISFSTAFRRSSNSPRYFDPATSAPRSSDRSCLPFSASGTSPLTMRSARPSTMAVLPTPGSPISTGLFLVRRASTWMVRRISSSRPITGSSFPSRASAVMSRAYFFSASKLDSAFGLSTVRPLRMSLIAFSSACGVTPALRSARAAGVSEAAIASSRRSCATYSSPALVAACCAASSRRTISVVNCGWPAPPPCTLGCRASSVSTAVSAALGSPPAVLIRPAAAPSSSSSSAFSRCSGVIRWWNSRIAMVWAA